ncbi:unnamed protein product [Linum tenue]|uniref:Uncharacterized protein n=1 Tax=Linum tenue TaxID=586396 RepID=A0AAV0PV72_9ROSI|nr:unnamed protein product [Linum tenue]
MNFDQQREHPNCLCFGFCFLCMNRLLTSCQYSQVYWNLLAYFIQLGLCIGIFYSNPTEKN